MPSPFPGMDPYIEALERWPGFHHAFLVRCADQLNARLPDDYVATLGERIEMVEEQDFNKRIRGYGPDVTVAHDEGASRGREAPSAQSSSAVATMEPQTLAQDIEFYDLPKQIFIEVTHLPDERVVTDIELLSPSNKTAGSSDRVAYLAKRRNLIVHEVNVVELDLLLGGARHQLREPLPGGDYYALVTKGPRWYECDVYAWTVRDPLPTIPVPLRERESAVGLDLAAAFTATYDDGRYPRLLRYRNAVPPLRSQADRDWALDLASKMAR